MKPTIRALVLAPTPFFGDRGCHVRIFEEVQALSRRGVECEIATYPTGGDPPGLTVRRAVRLPGVNARALGPGYARPLLDAALLATALRVASTFRPHIVHAHLHEGIAIGALVRSVSRAPLIADLQGSLTSELVDHGFVSHRGPVASAMRRMETWLVRRPDLALVSSTATRTLLEAQGVPPARIESLPDGVDLDRFRPRPPDPALRASLQLDGKKVVVFLGVLTEYQGVDVLLRSIPAVVAQVPDAHVLLMGYPHEEKYRNMARALGIADHVTFTGRVPYDRAPQYLALGDVAVSPKQSVTEANGKLLNYMACGLATVATATAVNQELLGATALYAPVGDSAALADRLVELLRDPARRGALGRAARERAEREFSWERLGDRLLGCYHRLTGAAPVPYHAAES